ncbi:MAG: hypothetical protein Q9187_000996 [Circinaria calcarea]
MEGRTRPCSASTSPYPVLEGSGGLNTLEAAFALRLENALWAILVTDEENAKSGKDREASRQMKSVQQLSWDAWGSPTGWADDPYDSYVSASSSPDYRPLTTITQPTAGNGHLHRSPPSSQASSSSLADMLKPGALPLPVEFQLPKPSSWPSKRKAEDEQDGERLSKRSRRTPTGTSCKAVININELTPPFTPSPRETSGAKAAVHGDENLAEAIVGVAQSKDLQGGCRRKNHTKTIMASRRSKRLQNLPP